ERDVSGRRLLALADDLLDLAADALQRNAQRFQRLGGYALTLVNKSQQDVLGPDVVVVEHPGLFLRQDDDPAGTVGKSLKHRRLPALHQIGTAHARRTRHPSLVGSPPLRCLLVLSDSDVTTGSCATGPVPGA